jgi:hypothetical protein
MTEKQFEKALKLSNALNLINKTLEVVPVLNPSGTTNHVDLRFTDTCENKIIAKLAYDLFPEEFKELLYRKKKELEEEFKKL